jgi:DNA-directed RNA polymerase alpha subunit
MNVSEKEFQMSMKLVKKYNRLVDKHERIIDTYYKNLNTHIDYSVSVDPKFDTITIWDLDINVYTINILGGTTNIRTLGDILRTNPRDIRRLRGMGKHRFNMLLESVDSYGVRWLQSHGVEKYEVYC